MGWSGWFSDSTGPGEVNEKSSGSDTHYLRTEDNAKSGSKSDHSHVMVREHSSGRSTGHGFHSFFGGKKK